MKPLVVYSLIMKTNKAASAIRKETADAAYARLNTEVDLMIAVLKDAVKAHAKKQRKSPTHWGFVGDLVQAKKELQEIINFVGNYDNAGADATRSM